MEITGGYLEEAITVDLSPEIDHAKLVLEPLFLKTIIKAWYIKMFFLI